MKAAHILAWSKTHRYLERCNDPEPLPRGQFCPDCIIVTLGYDFQEGQEIGIRDNGTGIPPEVKEKLFTPFFTTKPAGEGTGLGLSISHDIVVKQHSGSIEVDTEPGEFSEFRIILPRTGTFAAQPGGRA